MYEEDFENYDTPSHYENLEDLLDKLLDEEYDEDEESCE